MSYLRSSVPDKGCHGVLVEVKVPLVVDGATNLIFAGHSKEYGVNSLHGEISEGHWRNYRIYCVHGEISHMGTA